VKIQAAGIVGAAKSETDPKLKSGMTMLRGNKPISGMQRKNTQLLERPDSNEFNRIVYELVDKPRELEK